MQEIISIFTKSRPETLTDNFIRSIGSEWMLITAGSQDNFNTMTASWGAAGVLWNRPVAICFIRPTRHTYGFSEKSGFFSLSFFPPEHKDILKICGSRSGRDTDKIKITGLKPLLTENQAIGFEQARLCLECRKIYADDLDPAHFILAGAEDKFYPEKDYHRFYIGEITNVYIKG